MTMSKLYSSDGDGSVPCHNRTDQGLHELGIVRPWGDYPRGLSESTQAHMNNAWTSMTEPGLHEQGIDGSRDDRPRDIQKLIKRAGLDSCVGNGLHG